MPRQGGVKSIALDMWHVYVLQSERDGSHYIGCSNDYQRRLKEHNLGQSLSTFKKRPWKVIHLEAFENSSDAFAREKRLKSYKGGNGLRKLLNL